MSPTERLVAAGFTGKVVAGRYKLERMLGAGAVGEVWLAEHVHMRKRYAMKLIDARIATPEIAMRFEREAVAAANIVHPAIAVGTDFGRDEDGAFFLVLEYVEGRSLRALIKEGPISPARALHIARQVLGAAGAAHQKGVVHRDLKPENVMLAEKEGADPRAPRPKDVVKVLDFGIAKVDPKTLGTKPSIPPPGGTSNLTRAGTVYGTPIYMAPEQALGESVDARADLYAVGVILFELITGKPPFEGEPLEVIAHQVNEDSPALSTRTKEPITRELDAFVAALLSRDRDKRPADVPAALALLDEAERSLAAPTLTEPVKIVPAPVRRKRLPWIVAGAATLVLLPLLIFFVTRTPSVEDEESDAKPKKKHVAAVAPSPSPSPSPSVSASATASSSASVAKSQTASKKSSGGNEKGFGKLKGLFK